MTFEIDFENLSKTDLHMHTTFSDGNNSPSEMLRSAIEKGMSAIGISDHSYTFFDESYCIGRGADEEYRHTIKNLQSKCARSAFTPRLAKLFGEGKVKLYLGIEQDYYSAAPVAGYDYVIGSVHYLKKNISETGSLPSGLIAGEKTPAAEPQEGSLPSALIAGENTPAAEPQEGANAASLPSGLILRGEDVYIPVDESAEILLSAAQVFFGGDMYSLAEYYYKTVAGVAEKTHADIIGHFDLITKFNEKSALFDENNPRYISAWKAAADELLKTGALFEINTGAIARGWRTSPYPSSSIIRYIRERSGKFIYSSDAHSAENIAFGFEELAKA